MASQMGMGRYQWALFFLCGFGYVHFAPPNPSDNRYFLDLAWAQAGGLVGSAIQQELGVGGTSTILNRANHQMTRSETYPSPSTSA